MSAAVAATPELIPFEILERELITRRGLAEFVKRAWHIVDTSPLVWGWHLDEICAHLEAVTRGECRRLIINVPPGTSKSTIVSVLWPVWEWTLDPEQRFIHASYDDDVVLRDAARARALVRSDWFHARWGHKVAIPDSGADASRAVSRYYTTARGMRYSTTVRGGVTGQHADKIVIDDPIKPSDALRVEGAELEAVNTWWHQTLSTRFRDARTGAVVLIMQRLAENDLAGHLLEQGGWTLLRLPMKFEAEAACRTPWGGDRRTEEGELLCPERFPAEVVEQRARDLGPTGTASQEQQRPGPAEGTIFKEPWLENYWIELPENAYWIQSWDCAFKDTKASDFVAGGIWASADARRYLVDEFCERASFTATCNAIVAFELKWPLAVTKIIESKANGPAIVNSLSSKVSGLVEVEPQGGKIARAYACEGDFASGCVLLPHPTLARYPDGRRGAAWVAKYQAEMKGFPRGRNDDRVDQTTQALTYLRNNYLARLEAAFGSKGKTR